MTLLTLDSKFCAATATVKNLEKPRQNVMKRRIQLGHGKKKTCWKSQGYPVYPKSK